MMRKPVTTLPRVGLFCRMSLVLVSIASVILFAGCPSEPTGDPPIAFGTYRIGFVDGTEVSIISGNDFYNHNGEFDLSNVVVGERGSLAAAAPGWVRYIVDTNEEPTSSNNYVWIEHPYPYCQPSGVEWLGKPDNYDNWCTPCDARWAPFLQGRPGLSPGGRPAGRPGLSFSPDFCNEWTKYSHVAKNTVRSTGPVVVAGQSYAGAGLESGAFLEGGRWRGAEAARWGSGSWVLRPWVGPTTVGSQLLFPGLCRRPF